MSQNSKAYKITFEPPRDKTNKMNCAPSEDSDQPGHLPSLIRVFAVCMKKHWALKYLLSAQWRLWSDWADAQADLSLRWAHMSFCWFCHGGAHLLPLKTHISLLIHTVWSGFLGQSVSSQIPSPFASLAYWIRSNLNLISFHTWKACAHKVTVFGWYRCVVTSL